MRSSWTAVALMLAFGCAALIAAGPVHAEPAGTVRTDDGYGVRLGAADAPVQLEIFCEPQCPICADFEAASHQQLTHGLASHRLAVTYRWLTFLDERRNNDSSARLATALLVAADPATAPVAYQNFVAELYRQQDRLRNDPAAADIAEIARASGVPGVLADRIAAGEPGSGTVDTAALQAANQRRLSEVSPDRPGTPTVYDSSTGTLVDTEAPGWLDRLLSAG